MKGPLRYADIFNDHTFKYLLGEHGKQSMISLLKTLLNLPDIEDITYLPTENVGVGEGDIQSHYDISCKTTAGECFIVEAQVAEQRYFADRSFLYLSEMVHRAANAAREEWKKLHGNGWNYKSSPIYLLSLFKGRDGQEHATDDCIHTYRMQEVSTKEDLGADVTVTFVELGKYRWDLETTDIRDQWLYTLKNIKRLDEMPEWITDDGLKSLYYKSDLKNIPDQIRSKYLESMTTENDWLIAIDFAEEKAEARGIAEGRAEGLAEGLAMGKAEGKVEGKIEQSRAIAKMMKDAGEPVDKIALFTSLSEDEIAQL